MTGLGLWPGPILTGCILLLLGIYTININYILHGHLAALLYVAAALHGVVSPAAVARLSPVVLALVLDHGAHRGVVGLALALLLNC